MSVSKVPLSGSLSHGGISSVTHPFPVLRSALGFFWCDKCDEAEAYDHVSFLATVGMIVWLPFASALTEPFKATLYGNPLEGAPPPCKEHLGFC